ncbi:hypothetical protein [Novosphingopyxis sp. YJ-S2-01]|uniref:hypothetical protein n=1 Tax=Novosphingopyxis sp. YJ-S2-01 TaxID=2794021 RepID=UPI001E2C6576|nr:hypothetical protein [Novosphingopyxis sp. YJ-S2-01]
MKSWLIGAVALTVTGTGIALVPSAATPAQAQGREAASEWTIGPIIDRKNYSINMPLHPTRTRQGWSVAFPDPRQPGEIHYVTRRVRSLEGARRIVARYRIDAAPGTRFVPQEYPDKTATVGLYFQRRGDNWRAKGPYDFFRWYAPASTVKPLKPGVYEMSVDLDGDWGSVYGKKAAQNPAMFERALADVDNVGLTFGSDGGRGHGVYATGPARFTLLDFRIE